MKKGKFIVFEGLDGAGTTTQSKLIYKEFLKRNIPTILTFEPTDGYIGKLIRKFLQKKINFNEKTIALLFAADRKDHIEKIIIPSLYENKIVFSDRFVLSSYAYQSVNLDLNYIEYINNFDIVPDITFYLKIKPEISLARKKNKKEYYENIDYQKKVFKNYETLSLKYKKNHNIITINAENDIKIVFTEILQFLEKNI